jgi:hypothetical protein
MKLLKSELLDACLLRRTKRERSADISLPPRLIQHRHIRFNAEEEDYYTALYSQTQGEQLLLLLRWWNRLAARALVSFSVFRARFGLRSRACLHVG